MRRSQTYKVEVFDQIPTLNEINRASTGYLDNALSCRELAPPELRKVLQTLMGHVAHRRLHPAAETMLALGKEGDMTWSACRSLHRL